MYIQVYIINIENQHHRKGDIMQLGFSKRKITPTAACNLAGFDRYRPASKVHDDLYAKIMVAENDNKRYCLVACDLLAVDRLIVEPCKKKANELQIDVLNITATHTHSGPGGILDTAQGFLKGGKDLLGEIDKPLIEFIVNEISIGIQEALDDLSEGNIEIAYGKCANVGKNRNSLAFPGNDDLWVCKLNNKSSIVLLVNFACHPTILNDRNLEISADYPGRLDQLMANDHKMVMFLNGSCGDISTRFTRVENGFVEVDNKAQILRKAINALLSDSKTVSDIHIDTKNVQIKLAAKKAISLAEAQIKLNEAKEKLEKGIADNLQGAQLRLLENDVEGAQANIRFIKNYQDMKEYQLTIPMIKINDQIFIFIPGELFSQLSNDLQDDHTHFIGYANNYYMYFADRYSYDHYGYEALSSPFAKGESEKMIEIIKKEIKKWRQI